jgi:DNA replicative helicase MCM subunit Mcm2 (Cdc46/Mcm family)
MVAVRRTLPAPPELQSRWAAVLEEAELRPRVLQLHDRFPEERSLEISFGQIDSSDTGLADLLLERPEEVVRAGEQAMRELLPVLGPDSEGLRIRVVGLPVTAHRLIRAIRETDLNRLLAIDGIVRRVTEVRPQIRDAVFECVACRTKFHELQDEASFVFREPLECPESQGGCGKTQGRTRFRLVAEDSTYVDAQRIEIQEHPETLRHGAHPQGLSVLLTEDLTGRVLPGNRIVLNGVLKSFQRASASRGGVVRNTTFDLMVLGNSYESKAQEYDEIEISPEEVALIEKFRGDPTVVDKLVLSLAPTIKGMEQEKEAIALQLFGGVEKRHADGIRVRGDIHTLLVGDPGCLIGDERVTAGDGTTIRLNRMGRAHLQPIAQQVRLGAGMGKTAWATRFHRYRSQPVLEVVTESGKCIQGTFNHPLLRAVPGTLSTEWCRLDRLRVGDRLRVARSIRCWKTAPVPTGWKPPHYHHKSWPVRVPPVLDEDLAAILGYVLGDGSVSDRRVLLCAAATEGELADRISGLFERVFHVTPTRPKVRRGALYLQVDRTPVARWLRGLSRHRVPDAIFASPNFVVSSFLRWLFEADGCCFAGGRGRTAIQLRSANIELLRDVQILLLRWGIHGVILWGKRPRPHLKDGRWVKGDKSGTLSIRRSESMLRFAEKIGFVSSRKNSRLEEVRREARSRGRTWNGKDFERIVSVRPLGLRNVYDIEVPGPQRFIANGIISHNTAKSQLLRYVADVAPRGIYTSGKGATAAGLTAAAVKDDFAGGRWVLEAGMLVLADGGMAMIDELDKMSAEDRSAMHEVLEQGTVSIAKAGITSTLNARCPVLAAANPKWGRFTKDRSIAEQLDLPPTLLSRFDVIFSIRDVPDQARDRRLASRILASHLAVETGAESDARSSGEGAPFPPDLLKKYIAYARRNVRPVLTEEALATLEDYYVRVRRQGEEPDAPVPITARQLEALVRLSEAAARARLSSTVSVQDAKRATEIMENFLRRVSMTEEGKLDIDLTQTGVSHSQRERFEIAHRIMRELQEQHAGFFTAEQYHEAMARSNIPTPRADAILQTLRNQGEVIEARPNQLQLIRFG